MPSALPIAPADLQRRLAVLWLIVFIDLLGFGVLIPLIPFYALRLGLSAEWITPVIALHSLMQFVGAPMLGRLSDRHGRRPVLALSMAGHVAAYGLLAIADSLPLLIASRLLSGFTSGNLAAAYAYVSDVTPAESRATSLARISAAFALGFALGPALGGLLTGAADPAAANLLWPALLAAGLSALALVGILAFLPESHAAGEASRDASAPLDDKRKQRSALLEDPALRLMALLSLCVLSFAAMRESLLSLWLYDSFSYDAHTIGLVFTLNGLTVALAQFVAVGRLSRAFGEMATLRAGILCYAASWAGLLLAQNLPGILAAIALGALGTALFGTSLQTLVSLRAPVPTRGAIMGGYQSSGSLARFSGATCSGAIYGQWGRDLPFLLGAIAMLPALLITLRISNRLRRGDSA